MFSLKKKKPYSYIEPGIEPLVKALNETGIASTVASCEGHCRIMSRPYVYFSAPNEYAAIIEKLCRENSSLYTSWEVNGCFNVQYEMMFIISSPLCASKMESISWAYWLYWIKRKHLNNDINKIALLVKEAKSLYLGPNIKD